MSLQRVVPYLYKYIMMFIMSTCRIQEHGKHHVENIESEGKPWIYGIWHNNALISVWILRTQDTTAIVSNSSDGEIIARAIGLFGNPVIRGSTSKGAMQAAQKAMRTLVQNKSLAITPDGPRGPKYELQEGILYLAALTNTPIIPFHIECSRQWEFNSWDRLKLPKFFSKVHLCFGEPIQVNQDQLSSDEKKETTRQEVQQTMIENVETAIRLARK